MDQEAFGQMHRAHAQRVLVHCLRLTGPASAQDAVAETFVIAWRRRDDLPTDPLPWLLLVSWDGLSPTEAAGQQACDPSSWRPTDWSTVRLRFVDPSEAGPRGCCWLVALDGGGEPLAC